MATSIKLMSTESRPQSTLFLNYYEMTPAITRVQCTFSSCVLRVSVSASASSFSPCVAAVR